MHVGAVRWLSNPCGDLWAHLRLCLMPLGCCSDSLLCTLVTSLPVGRKNSCKSLINRLFWIPQLLTEGHWNYQHVHPSVNGSAWEHGNWMHHKYLDYERFPKSHHPLKYFSGVFLICSVLNVAFLAWLWFLNNRRHHSLPVSLSLCLCLAHSSCLFHHINSSIQILSFLLTSSEILSLFISLFDHFHISSCPVFVVGMTVLQLCWCTTLLTQSQVSSGFRL